MVRIMGICGTWGLESANGRMLEIILALCEQQGAEICVWDLASTALPFVGEPGCWDHAAVKEYQQMATDADAFILSSPEYHGTMSGVMKNQMDWITNDIARGKPFGLVSTLGGASNSNTLNHMRISIRNLHGWVIPEQVAVPHVKDAFDDDGALNDEAMQERVEGFSTALVAAAELLASTR